MTDAEATRNTLPACTYADDLNVLAGTARDITVQAEKVSKYAEWADMTVNMKKSTVTGAMYGSHADKPYDLDMLSRRLQPVQIAGDQVRFVSPMSFFRFLGLVMTVDMNWSYQAAYMQSKLREQAAAVARSCLASWRKEQVLRTVLNPAAEYGLALCPYSPVALLRLDRVLVGLVKRIHWLPQSTANAFAHTPVVEGRLGCPSLRAAAAYAASRNCRRSLEAPGQLGACARALLAYQLKLLR